MGGFHDRPPAVVAVDQLGATVHAATDRGDRLCFPLMLRADGDRLSACAAGDGHGQTGGQQPEAVALWDWIDRPALPVGTELWTVEEALAAALTAVCAQTGAGPETVRVLVVPATFGAVRRARVVAAAGPRWVLCDSGAAAVLGGRSTVPDGRCMSAGPQVVVEAAGRGRVHALLVDDPGSCGADGRSARPVAPPWADPQIAAAAGVLLPAGTAAADPLWSVRAEDAPARPAADRELVLRGALRYGRRSFGQEGTGSRAPAS